MCEKSHVGLGHQLCPVCGAQHSPVVLLDKRLRPSLSHNNIIGLELCAQHAAMSAEYVALVEAAAKPGGEQGVELTGNAAQLRWEVAAEVLKTPLSRDHPFVFVEPGAIAALKEMAGVGT